MDSDPLAGQSVSTRGVLARDRLVHDSLLARGIPFVMTTSGGYTDLSHKLIADSISGLIEKMGAPITQHAPMAQDYVTP